MSVSEADVQKLGCGSCGSSEWHKAESKSLGMATKKKTDAVSAAVEAIIDDLTDRRKQAWYDIDEDIQEEIKAGWREIILSKLG